jgi:hypothetical protein
LFVEEILKECVCVLLYNISESPEQVAADVERSLSLFSGSDAPQSSRDKLMASSNARKLRVLESCADGFEISEMDLLIRGPGDIFGLRQHGRANFKCGKFLFKEALMLFV